MQEFLGLAVAVVLGYTVLIQCIGFAVRFFLVTPAKNTSIDDWSIDERSQTKQESLFPESASHGSPVTVVDNDFVPVAPTSEDQTIPVAYSEKHFAGNRPMPTDLQPVDQPFDSDSLYATPGHEVELSYQNLDSGGYPKIGWWKALALSAGTIVVASLATLLLGIVGSVFMLMLSSPLRFGTMEGMLLSVLIFCPVATLLRLQVNRGGFGPTFMAVAFETVLLFSALWLYSAVPPQ